MIIGTKREICGFKNGTFKATSMSSKPSVQIDKFTMASCCMICYDSKVTAVLQGTL